MSWVVSCYILYDYKLNLPYDFLNPFVTVFHILSYLFIKLTVVLPNTQIPYTKVGLSHPNRT